LVFHFGAGVFYRRLALGKTGKQGLYGLPISLMIMQYALVLWLEHRAKTQPLPATAVREENRTSRKAPHSTSRSRPNASCKWRGWPIRSPIVAINTVAAIIPQLAARFQLSPAQTGMVCSLWFCARFIAFAVLWKWTGWHYRFRWLLAAFIGLVAGFSMMLLAAQLWLLVLAQVVFGFAIGLIYYSSLFYSMDAAEAKGEHGGLHEAAIGLGIFAGPAVGASTLTFLPQHPNSGTLAVSVLLMGGLAGLLGIWGMARWQTGRGRRSTSSERR